MSERGYWMRRVVDGIAATAEATFPENDVGAPDWRSTAMVERTLDYLDELPPRQRRMVMFLYAFVEIAAVFLVLGFRRLSRIPAGRRTEVIRAWRGSRSLLLRILGDAVKASNTMIYMSHPSVIDYIGEFRRCEHAHDPLRIAVRPDALTRTTSE